MLPTQAHDLVVTLRSRRPPLAPGLRVDVRLQGECCGFCPDRRHVGRLLRADGPDRWIVAVDGARRPEQTVAVARLDLHITEAEQWTILLGVYAAAALALHQLVGLLW